MTESSQTRFTKGEARCHACGGVIRFEFSETSPRLLKEKLVPCSGCARDYELEIVEDNAGTHVKAKDCIDRQ